MARIYIAPSLPGTRGEGGVLRVVEAQHKHIPAFGWEVVDDPASADLIAVHSGEWVSRKVNPSAPRVFHTHGMYWNEYEWGKWADSFNRKLIDHAHRADLVITPCEWVADIFRREMWINPAVVHNGIDPVTTRSRKYGKYVLWNKARVNSVCDPTWMYELAKAAPRTQFISTHAPEGAQALPNLKLTGTVPYDDSIKLVRDAEVYLSTTREVFAVGVLESLAHGVPVLGFDWGGNREAVRHLVDGYLVRPGDIAGLLVGLDYIRANRARLSAEAVARSKDFVWADRIGEMARLYDTLLQGSSEVAPKVSVVIPCYNLGKYLPDAVWSVGSQGLGSDAEIIIVDDASTDQDTIESLKTMETLTGVKVIRNSSNLYLSEALNVGFKAARGKYFMALDADNALPVGSLATLVQALDWDDSLDCVYGAMQLMREDGTLIVNRGTPYSFPPAKFDPEAQIRKQNQVPSTNLMRRALWERARGYHQHTLWGDDADLWTRALAMGFKFARVTDAPTLTYRRREDSMGTTAGEDVKYDWTSWTPKTPPMGVSGKPEINDPVVSVVIHVELGQEQFVRDAVDSLWTQTFKAWECFIKLDGEVKAMPLLNLPSYVKWLGETRGEFILDIEGSSWLEPDALDALVWAAKSAGEPARVTSGAKLWNVGLRGWWHILPTEELGDTGAVLTPVGIAPTLDVILDNPVLNRRGLEQKEWHMACATCGSSKSKVSYARRPVGGGAPGPRGAVAPVDEGVVRIEFTGSGTRTKTLEGMTYRFGSDHNHRIRDVRKSHASHFLGSKEFKVYNVTPPPTPTPEPEPPEVALADKRLVKA